MAQHTLQITISEDTYIDKLNPDTNYGSSTEIKIGGPSDSAFDYEKIALLKWSEASLPARKRFVSRKLNLYATTQLTENCVITATDPVDFSEMVATWNTIMEGLERPSAWGREAQNVINAYATFNINGYDAGLAMLGLMAPNNAIHTFQSRHAANPPYIEIVYEDVPPNTPAPTEPIGSYKDSKKVIRFEWQYISDVGGTQKAYDLQWSADQINWTTISKTTSNTYYDMPADALPTGNIYWRVRTYNEYDEVGDYCTIQGFYAIGAPEAPHINTIPIDTSRPKISWGAFGQQSYQLQIMLNSDLVYDSGIIPHASERQHKIKSWLADGSYIVKLRIMNEYGLWSEWGSTLVTISTAKPNKPALSVQPSEYGAELNINISGATEYYLIYRDGICIGKTTSNTYIDNAVQSGKEYIYYVRAVSTAETYQDSDSRLLQCSFRYAVIAPVSDLADIICFSRALNVSPKRTYSGTVGGSFAIYAGRKRPVWEPSENATASITMTYFLKTWADVEKLIALFEQNSTVLYRDFKGRKLYGVLGNLSENDERVGYTVSFAINEIDYNEEVEV